ncbi:SIR2 family protein [Dolosigranulum pigrum]|uniref:SIR2 family protein n=1 Tax=Dolosigranulum pigrum TaxID=29394 RepID=UPI001AD88E97|nr:SIR2 family protein [Dolosigranulum pigrum]QTJ58368.1 hypothetical protein FE336_03620 [Dolosigranulum pigrum]
MNKNFDENELDKIIRGKNINFLIGAGASVPLFPPLRIGGTNYSFEDIVSNSNILKPARDFMYMYYFKNWIEPMNNISNIRKEHISDSDNDVFKNYKKLVQWFHNFLQHESNESPKRINVFTTNYDLLFEFTFDEFLLNNSMIYFNDGSRGFINKYISNKNFYLNITHSGYNDNYRREVPTVNLFKLHGSLSWEVDNDNNKISVATKNKTIESINTYLKDSKITKEKLEEVIKTIEDDSDLNNYIEQLNDKVKNLNLSEEIRKKFRIKYRKLAIINPNKYKFSKTVLEQYYYQMIRSFSYELERKQSVLIVFGFSFADEHIRDIFERSLLNPELIVIIISYSLEEQERMKDIFQKNNNIKFFPVKFERNSSKNETHGDFEYLLKLLGGQND